jgi:hypothetical protein
MNTKNLQLANQKRSARIHINIYADMNLIMLNISLFYSYHCTIYQLINIYQYLLYYTSNKNSILKKLIKF